MDATTAANVIRWYQSLEEQLQEVLNVVPPQGKNPQTVWSPKLATVLVEACNLIESVLYDLIGSSPSYDATTKKVTVPGESKPRKRDRLELHHYAQLYCGPLRLHACKAVFFHEPLGWQIPFDVWNGQASFRRPPDWWTVHNASKHRRLKHFAEFTLEKAIAALAGALVVIASAPAEVAAQDLCWAMIQHEWIDPVSEDTPHWLPSFYAGSACTDRHLCVETSLFAVLVGQTPIQGKVDQLWQNSGYRPFAGGNKLRTWTWHKTV
jgi:hypothetical protein